MNLSVSSQEIKGLLCWTIKSVIMEIKAPGNKPQWLQDILEKYGLMEHKFSKYSCAYHKSQGLPYAPRPSIESAGIAYA